MSQNLENAIATLLLQAGNAHHHYEQTILNGIYDTDWPNWYAEYAIAHGLNTLLTQPVSTQDLSAFLSRTYTLYKTENATIPWATFTAQKAVDELFLHSMPAQT